MSLLNKLGLGLGTLSFLGAAYALKTVLGRRTDPADAVHMRTKSAPVQRRMKSQPVTAASKPTKPKKRSKRRPSARPALSV